MSYGGHHESLLLDLALNDIAQALARLGVRTVAIDVDADGLAETAARAEGFLQTAVTDVADAVGIRRATGVFDPADIPVRSAGGVCGQVGKPARCGCIATGLTRQLAHEFGPFGITVNSVAPGLVRSNPATERQRGSYGPHGQKPLVESVAVRRLDMVDDIVHAVLFLASDFTGWINDQTIGLDGGK